jgi:hypothetical protein
MWQTGMNGIETAVDRITEYTNGAPPVYPKHTRSKAMRMTIKIVLGVGITALASYLYSKQAYQLPPLRIS